MVRLPFVLYVLVANPRITSLIHLGLSAEPYNLIRYSVPIDIIYTWNKHFLIELERELMNSFTVQEKLYLDLKLMFDSMRNGLVNFLLKRTVLYYLGEQRSKNNNRSCKCFL